MDAINLVSGNPSSLIQQALWRCAIIHYIKCFGDSKARFQLNYSAIYQHEPIEAFQVFTYFKNLRNKHFVHDQNSYAQSIPGAVLNGRENPNKIEKIISIEMIANTLTEKDFKNLHQLIVMAHVWCISEYDLLCGDLKKELEKQSYDSLFVREGVVYTAPTVEANAKTRAKI